MIAQENQQPKKEWYKKWWVLLIAIIAFSFEFGCSSESYSGNYEYIDAISYWEVTILEDNSLHGGATIRGQGSEKIRGSVNSNGELSLINTPELTGHVSNGKIKFRLASLPDESFILRKVDKLSSDKTSPSPEEAVNNQRQHAKERAEMIIADFEKDIKERGYDKKWQCLMKCSGSNHSGICPVCGMDYKENPDWKSYKKKIEAGLNPATGQTLEEVATTTIDSHDGEFKKLLREEFNKLKKSH